MMLQGRRAILLDLDGTLVDSRPGIIASYTAALNRLGHTPAADLDMTALIGPPIGEAMAHLLAPFGDARIEEATALYRAHYASEGLFDCFVYPGIQNALQALSRADLALYVATSKRTVFARRMIENSGLAPFFAGIYGSEPGGDLEQKPALIRHVLAECGIAPETTVMVGDRAFDIQGAIANAIPGIGVLWGYGSRDELADAGAAAIVATPAELVHLLGLEMRD